MKYTPPSRRKLAKSERQQVCDKCHVKEALDADKTLQQYAAAARSIAVNLSEFLDRSLPYPDMIADAARKASAEIIRLRRRKKETTRDEE